MQKYPWWPRRRDISIQKSTRVVLPSGYLLFVLDVVAVAAAAAAAAAVVVVSSLCAVPFQGYTLLDVVHSTRA